MVNSAAPEAIGITMQSEKYNALVEDIVGLC